MCVKVNFDVEIKRCFFSNDNAAILINVKKFNRNLTFFVRVEMTHLKRQKITLLR